MVTDKLIAVFYNLLASFAEVLPLPGSPPGWLTSNPLLQFIDLIVPVGLFTALVAFLVLGYGGLYVFRVVRLFTPGG